ncbi:MAG: Nre family DNA repair protein [Thermoplasmata archaeon]|nr:Nre family DNA repair protein [Thermoplasmata archaeon]
MDAPTSPPIPGLAPFESLRWSIPGLREDPTMCLRCRAAQMLCGKPACPILIKYDAYAKTLPMIGSKEVNGSSPPGLFVGRFGWPKVSLGPLVTPLHGDTLLMDTPEEWVGRSVPEVVGFRTMLVRGTRRFHVDDAETADRLIEDVQTLALARESVETEATFRRPPRGHLALSEDLPPYGPTAPIDSVRLDVRRVDQHLERLASDTDATARVAVHELYGRGVRVSRIQRAFSAGTLGRHGRRRFVPTRWSITAVDDLLGLDNLERVKELPELSEYWVRQLTALDNRWLLIYLPGVFRYESIETWYPNTLWNPAGERVVMMGDHEGYRGRTKYASIGGCYYAARLAITEDLLAHGRQAGAIVLREVHPGEILPLGVWNVREHVRAALRTPPERLSGLHEVLERVRQTFTIPLERWLAQSALLHEARTQRRLDEYLDAPAVPASAA